MGSNDICNTSKKNVYVNTARAQREKLLYTIKWYYLPLRDNNNNTIQNDKVITANDMRLYQLVDILEKSLSPGKQSVILIYTKCEFEMLLNILQPIFETIELKNIDDLYTALSIV